MLPVNLEVNGRRGVYTMAVHLPENTQAGNDDKRAADAFKYCVTPVSMFSLNGEPIWSNNAANQFFTTGLGKNLTTIVEDGKKLSVLEALFRTIVNEKKTKALNDRKQSGVVTEVGDEDDDDDDDEDEDEDSEDVGLGEERRGEERGGGGCALVISIYHHLTSSPPSAALQSRQTSGTAQVRKAAVPSNVGKGLQRRRVVRLQHSFAR